MTKLRIDLLVGLSGAWLWGAGLSGAWFASACEDVRLPALRPDAGTGGTDGSTKTHKGGDDDDDDDDHKHHHGDDDLDCGSPTRRCKDRCVVLSSDPDNCGNCGKKCASGECSAGKCK